jgi:ASPIC and UnbV
MRGSGVYQDAIAQYKSRRREEKAAKNQAAEAISPRMILGVGKATKIDSLEFKWPGGRVDKLTNLLLNKYIKVVEGGGT